MSDFEQPAEQKMQGTPAEDSDGPLPWERSNSVVESDNGWGRGVDIPSEFQEIRTRIHRRLLERLNLANLSERNQEDAEDEVRKVVRELLLSEETPLNLEEREMLVEQVINEVFGLGPLEPLVNDPQISDILVNTSRQVRMSSSRMTDTLCRSSIASSRPWVDESTIPHPWSMRGYRTVPGSTR
jgi:hypothetical protein